MPKLHFPGGMLAGCSAGFLNVAKIKGSHNAMKTGMLAAEEIYGKVLKGEELSEATFESYQEAYNKSWVYEELKKTRNFKDGFKKSLYAGLVHGGLVLHVT